MLNKIIIAEIVNNIWKMNSDIFRAIGNRQKIRESGERKSGEKILLKGFK